MARLATLDARVEGALRWGRRRLTLWLEAFNLANLRSEVEEYVAWDAGFREPTLVQPPRSLRVGARVDF